MALDLNSRGLISVDPDRLDAETLRSVLHYDSLTGAFTWKVQRGGTAKPGSRAGSPDRDGYLLIRLGDRNFKAHRLARLYVHGRWPEGDIDHINGNASDNRLCNLRDVTHSQNLINTELHAHNTSGLHGVSWHKEKKKWRASITVNRRFRHLGYFDRREEAAEVYLAAAEKIVGGPIRPNYNQEQINASR